MNIDLMPSTCISRGPTRGASYRLTSVALFGYRVQDGVEETVIVLHYSDPDAARKDAGELEETVERLPSVC